MTLRRKLDRNKKSWVQLFEIEIYTVDLPLRSFKIHLLETIGVGTDLRSEQRQEFDSNHQS